MDEDATVEHLLGNFTFTVRAAESGDREALTDLLRLAYRHGATAGLESGVAALKSITEGA